MKNLHNLNELSIYFIGIGGISMSGLAKLMLKLGAKVKGSDAGRGKEINILLSRGVEIFNIHSSSNITGDIDLIVYSGAIKEDNPELCRARELHIPTLERSEFLGIIARRYRRVIAISGTHGKTTTTAMLGYILHRAKLNPTMHLGGESVNLGGNTIIGGDDYFVVEACEYRNSFRKLKPSIGVITNIEVDHLDFYPDFDSIRNAFMGFAKKSQILVCSQDIDIGHSHAVVIGRDWRVGEIEAIGGGYNFNVYYLGEFYATFRLNCIGVHNVSNALFAIAIADILRVKKEIIIEALSDFMGVERRYERIAQFNNCDIIIDYAHHPTELQASIAGIKSVYKKILCVFQPHTYSRTQKLFDDFVETLSCEGDVAIYKTYPAREDEIPGGRAIDLYHALKNARKAYFDSFASIIDYIFTCSLEYDCILVLGAGDLADQLKTYYKTHLI